MSRSRKKSPKMKNDAKTPNTKLFQSSKFVDTARELGCDEDETAFEERLKRIIPKSKGEFETTEK